MNKYKNKTSFLKTKKKRQRKEKKKKKHEMPRFNFFFHQWKKGQFIISWEGECTAESSIGLKVQLVLLVQGTLSG